MTESSITLDAGSGGDSLATDTDASSRKIQQIKILDGTASSKTEIQAGNGTSANAIRCTLSSDSTGQVKLAAGSAVVGEVTIGAATTAAGDLAKAEDAAHASGDVGVMALAVRTASPADKSGADGDYEPLQMDEGHLFTYPEGRVADDAAAGTVKPLLTGGVAVASDSTDPTSVAEGDAAKLRTDLNRRLLTSGIHPNHWSVSADYGAAQTNTTVKASPGASLKLFLTDINISNGAVAGNVTLLDGSGGTVLWESYLAINSNVTANLRTPIMLTANTLLAVTSTSSTTHSLNISGFIAP
jgi:hypothetical protein